MQKNTAYVIGTIAVFLAVAAMIPKTTTMNAMAQPSNGTGANVTALSNAVSNAVNSAQSSSSNSQPVCGEVIKHDVRLTANLNCSGDGLIVGADGVTIDLNGFFITGPGSGTSTRGIIIPNVGDVKIIGPSVISGFGTAIDYTGGPGGGNVTAVIISNNGNGISLTGTKGVFIQDDLINRNNVGISSQSSSGGNVSSNIINNNAQSGIVLVNTQNMGVSTNNIIGDGSSGVFVDSQSDGNNIGFNNVFGNNVDINNANGLPLNINNNSMHDNNCFSSNPGGLCIGR